MWYQSWHHCQCCIKSPVSLSNNTGNPATSLAACTGAVLLPLGKLLTEPSLGLPSCPLLSFVLLPHATEKWLTITFELSFYCQITLLTIFWAGWTSPVQPHKSHSLALVLYPPSFPISAAVGDLKPESGFQVLLHQHWWEADKFPWSAGHTFNGATYAVCCVCDGSMLLVHIQSDVHAAPTSFSGCSSAPQNLCSSSCCFFIH